MIQGHGGNIYALARRLGCTPEAIVDVSSNINPLGPPPGLLDELQKTMAVVCALPEVDSRTVSDQTALDLGVPPEDILAGAGTTQFIYSMFHVLASRSVLIVGPTYADYADACRLHGVQADFFLAEEKDGFVPDPDRLADVAGAYDTVVLCNPNNPTGVLIDKQPLTALCQKRFQTRFVIDESYLPFLPDAGRQSMAGCGLPNVLVLHSFSKIYRLPGLRIGFLISDRKIIRDFARVMAPWRLNSLAQAAVRFLHRERQSVDDFTSLTCRFVDEERTRFFERLSSCNHLTLFPSRTSFFLIRLPRHTTAETICERFAQERILVRDCSNFTGLDDRFIRIAVNTAAVNRRLAELLVSFVG